MTDIFGYLQKQIAYRFTVSVNKERSVKRSCLVAGSLLFIDEAGNERPLTLFLPHFKIVKKPRGKHFTIFLIAKHAYYNMMIRLKSVKEQPVTEFSQACIIARDMYAGFEIRQSTYAVQYKGTENLLPARLVIYEKSFELQGEDGILLASDTLLPHPDVFSSTDDTLKITCTRDGVPSFSFMCQDITELSCILLSLNHNGPAISKAEIKERKEHPFIVKGEVNQAPVQYDDIEDLPSESETFSTVSCASSKSFDNFQSTLLSNRSAFRHLRSGIFREMFNKSQKKKVKDNLPPSLSCDFLVNSHSDLFIPDVQLGKENKDETKIIRKSEMSFDERMSARLAKFESKQKLSNVFPGRNETFDNIVQSYRSQNRIVEQTPLPVLAKCTEDSQTFVNIESDSTTIELFYAETQDITEYQEDLMERIEVDTAIQELYDQGILLSHYNISVPRERTNLDQVFFKEFGYSIDEDYPSMFASALLHGALGAVNVYNGLTCIPFTVSEVNMCLSDHPFSTFEGCCKFFFNLINLKATSHFFHVIETSYAFKESNYQNDALINIPNFCYALSGLDFIDKLEHYNMKHSRVFSKYDLALRLDKVRNVYCGSKTASWIIPLNSKSPIFSIALIISQFYSESKHSLNQIWSAFTRSCDEIEQDKMSDFEEIFINAKNECQSKSTMYVYFVLSALLKEQFLQWFLISWEFVKKALKSTQTDEQVLFMAHSLKKTETDMKEAQIFNLYYCATQISEQLEPLFNQN